jgi:glutamate-1-semialdehyde-2,1-aminomutase
MGMNDRTSRSSKKSKEWHNRAKKVIVGGGQPHKRPSSPWPLIIEKGHGSRIWDADGNEYIDYLMAYGPVLLGYGYPKVVEAVAESIKNGNIYNVGHPLEIELAEKIVELIPSADRVTFFNGGSNATTGAIKLARAYTNKEKVVRCGYHGWHDWCHNERGALKATAEYTLSMKFNDLESTEDIFKKHPGEIACVILEPASFELPKADYLEELKKLTNKNGALLIFDEVKTGFRYALGGAQQHFGVMPDISVFGKAVGNGFGIAFVVGRETIMDEVADVWIAATFHGEVSGVVAAMTTITEIEEKNGIDYMWKQGRKLLEGYKEIVKRLGMEEISRIEGAPPMPFFGFRNAEDEDHIARFINTFYSAALDGGLYLPSGHIWFHSLSHTDEDIARTLEVSEHAIKLAKRSI